MKCGKTHFVEVLSRPELEITAEPETGRGLELDVRPLTFQKVKATSLKNTKAPKPDLIIADMLKADIDLSARTLTPPFGKI